MLEDEANQLQFVLNYGFVNYFEIEIGKKYKYYNTFDGSFESVIIINSIEEIYDYHSCVDSHYYTAYKFNGIDTDDGLDYTNVLYMGRYGWLYESFDGSKIISLEESEYENR